MLASPAELTKAFDGLTIARQSTFVQLVNGGRLRYVASTDGRCDLIDDYSSRLICECIAAGSSLLMVWPDLDDRRAPLALAAGIVCDSVSRMGGASGRERILYVGSDTSIREQFASVRVGNTALTGVFAQEIGRGAGQLQRTGPESSLPVVTSIVSPAQPERIIRMLRPQWIAVDCGRRSTPSWLPSLLEAAKNMQVPVIGWTGLHLSPMANLWRDHGACVYRWPKVTGPAARITELEDLSRRAGVTELTPIVLNGAAAVGVAAELSQGYLHLARQAGRSHGQLARDAQSIAWRYLRLLESLPVPVDLYDAECVNYWRMPSLSRLQATLDRFVQALNREGTLRADLGAAYDRLSAAHSMLQEQGESPLWLAIATLAVEAATPSLFVFQSRAHRDLFRFALLSKYNISEDDLRGLGVSLAALSDLSRDNGVARDSEVTVVGLPSRMLDWRMESTLEHDEVRVVVWPHLEDTLRRRAAEWSVRLDGGCDGAAPLRIASGAGRIETERVRVGTGKMIDLGVRRGGPSDVGARLALWKKPEAADAIRSLFAVQDVDEDGNDESVAFRPDTESTDSAAPLGEDDWIEYALEVVFDDGSQILLPLDDCVSAITRTSGGVKIEPRYSRSLRVGDEIMLLDGQHRRSVYDLLVSRVHSHSTISPWLNLIDRWHQDLRRAFIEAKRRRGETFEGVLTLLQAQGSTITTAASVRGWILGFTLAPSDWRDIRRLGDILNIAIAKQFPREIGNAAGKLAGLHRSLSNRLNRWLESEDAGAAVVGGTEAAVDADLGLTIDDFKHSLVRGRIDSIAQVHGPFLRSHIGQLRRAAS